MATAPMENAFPHMFPGFFADLVNYYTGVPEKGVDRQLTNYVPVKGT